MQEITDSLSRLSEEARGKQRINRACKMDGSAGKRQREPDYHKKRLRRALPPHTHTHVVLVLILECEGHTDVRLNTGLSSISQTMYDPQLLQSELTIPKYKHLKVSSTGLKKWPRG